MEKVPSATGVQCTLGIDICVQLHCTLQEPFMWNQLYINKVFFRSNLQCKINPVLLGKRQIKKLGEVGGGVVMDRPLRKICFFYFILIFRLLQQQKLQATNPISSRGRGKAVMAGPLRKIYGFPSGWLLKKGRQGGEISVLASKPVLPLLRLSGSCIRFYIHIWVHGNSRMSFLFSGGLQYVALIINVNPSVSRPTALERILLATTEVPIGYTRRYEVFYYMRWIIYVIYFEERFLTSYKWVWNLGRKIKCSCDFSLKYFADTLLALPKYFSRLYSTCAELVSR